jgi:hypothetical protein
MPKAIKIPKARLLKIALEARMKPELQRFALLHRVAAEVSGYPDWHAGFSHVRLINTTAHCSVLIGSHELRYVQDSGDRTIEQARSSALSERLFRTLQISGFSRMGYRRWYLLPLEMEFREAVDLFYLRYYPEADPIRGLGHRVRDLLYRVDTTDEGGWHWHITFAPIPRSQTMGLINYDFDAHWPGPETSLARGQIYEGLPEVALYQDLDCYRSEPEMSLAEWQEFAVRSREKMDQVSQSLYATFFGQEPS